MASPSLALPGVLFVGEDERTRLVAHLGPAAGWMIPRGILGWSSEVSVVAREALTEQVRRDAKIVMPEEQIPPARLPLSLQAALHSPLVAISGRLTDKLVEAGIRVHTVGADRVTSSFYYIAEGGGEAPLRVEGDLVAAVGAMLGERADNAAIERVLDGLVDRLLRSLSRDRVSELSLELAAALPRAAADGSGMQDVDLDAFEGELGALVGASEKYAPFLREIAAKIGDTNERRVDIPLFGDARKVSQGPFDLTVGEQKVALVTHERWVATGPLTEPGEAKAAAPAEAPEPAPEPAPKAEAASQPKTEVAPEPKAEAAPEPKAAASQPKAAAAPERKAAAAPAAEPKAAEATPEPKAATPKPAAAGQPTPTPAPAAKASVPTLAVQLAPPRPASTPPPAAAKEATQEATKDAVEPAAIIAIDGTPPEAPPETLPEAPPEAAATEPREESALVGGAPSPDEPAPEERADAAKGAEPPGEAEAPEKDTPAEPAAQERDAEASKSAERKTAKAAAQKDEKAPVPARKATDAPLAAGASRTPEKQGGVPWGWVLLLLIAAAFAVYRFVFAGG